MVPSSVFEQSHLHLVTAQQAGAGGRMKVRDFVSSWNWSAGGFVTYGCVVVIRIAACDVGRFSLGGDDDDGGGEGISR